MASAVLTATTLAQPRLFTVEEYSRMWDAGIFRHNERLELLRGEIIQMCAIHPPHNGTVLMLSEVLNPPLSGKAHVLIQGAVVLDERSAPEPDVAVLRWSEDRYRTQHVTPADVLLIMEVSDSTLAYDRDVKALDYAKAVIAEYWIWDLQHRALLIHRDPHEDGYHVVMALRGEQAAASPIAFPELVLRVEDILPPAPPA